MSAMRCYLDYNATAPLRETARAAMMSTLGLPGNPSSVHREGREARRFVEEARHKVGTLVGAAADRVIFTSGATEAANLVLTPQLSGPGAPHGTRRLMACGTEHAAVLQGHRFPDSEVTRLPVGPNGVIDLDALRDALTSCGGAPALVALQAANNETGVLQPVRAAADLVHSMGGLVVCDAVQAVGRLPFRITDAGADAVLISGHKLGGSQGTGAAILAAGILPGPALVRGGGQERGFRSGTENVAGIAGFGAAAAVPLETERLEALRDRLEGGLAAAAEDMVVFGAGTSRLPNTTCFTVPGTTAETLLISLDLAGIAVSSGSACSSGKVARSHVLDAMGVPSDMSRGALRVSIGWASTEAHIDRFLEAFGDTLGRMRRRPLHVAA